MAKVRSKKDAYYFSHDCDAKDDPKIVMLIEELGLEAYGIYWIVIETLRQQPTYSYPIALLPALARRFNTTAEKVKAVVGRYGLFVIDDQEFFSESLNRRMGVMQAKIEQRRDAANKRWGNKIEKKNALVMLTHSESNANVMRPHSECNEKERKGKESKVKESKVKEIKVININNNIKDFFKEVIHSPKPNETVTLMNLEKEYKPEIIATAIQEAANQNIKNISYVETTLETWKKDNVVFID